MYIIKGWLDFDVLGPSWQKIPLNKRKCETSGDSVLRRTGLGTHGSSDDVLLMTSAWCKALLPLQYTLQGPMLGSGKYTQSSVYKTHTMAESRSEVVKVMFILSQNVGTITLFTEYTWSHCVLEWDNEFLAAPGLLYCCSSWSSYREGRQKIYLACGEDKQAKISMKCDNITLNP